MNKIAKALICVALLITWPALMFRALPLLEKLPGDIFPLLLVCGVFVPLGQWLITMSLGRRWFGVRCWRAYIGAVLAFFTSFFFSFVAIAYFLTATPIFAGIGLAWDLRGSAKPKKPPLPSRPGWRTPLLAALPLIFFGGILAASHYQARHRGTPFAIKHGTFTGEKTFSLTNFLQIQVQSDGQASFDMKHWVGQGQQAPCVEYSITSSAGAFRVDDCGTGQWEAQINGRAVRASKDHHILIDHSGAIKVVEGAVDFTDFDAYSKLESIDSSR